MKTLFPILVLLCMGSAYGQRTFDLDISSKYSIRVETAVCDTLRCSGPTTFSLYRRGSVRPFQQIALPDTDLGLDESGRPELEPIGSKSNGKWSSIYLADFNFDGVVDLALADGQNGGYGATSYRIYLFSKGSGRFVYSKHFTKLAQGPFFGAPEIDGRHRTLNVFWKSGAGFHEEQRYRVVKGQPIKVYERSEDSMLNDGNVYITTKERIKGGWRVWTKTLKRSTAN
jgi:hypothetical protein